MSDFLERRGPDVHDTSIGSPFAQVSRRLRTVVSELVGAAGVGPDSTLVDFGCADSPYRSLLPAGRYIGVDLPGNSRADVELNADGTVDLPDAVADVVLSTQVLEHVVDPQRYLAESLRLLRPGGELVLTTHGIMYLHRDPTDYWRWTCDGLVKITEDAGLEVVELRGVLGLVGSSLQLLQAGIVLRAPKLLRRPLVVAFQLLIGLAERMTSERSRSENALVLAVRARKPASITP